MHAPEPDAPAMERDRADFVAAFAIGAALGAGAVWLLRPSPPKGPRTAPDVKVRRKKAVRGGARRLQRPGRGTTPVFAGLRDQLRAAGRSVAADLRDEIGAAVESAREELVRAIGKQVADATERFEQSARRRRRS